MKNKLEKQQAQKENIKKLVDFLIRNPRATQRFCIASGFQPSFVNTFFMLALRRAYKNV